MRTSNISGDEIENHQVLADHQCVWQYVWTWHACLPFVALLAPASCSLASSALSSSDVLTFFYAGLGE